MFTPQKVSHVTCLVSRIKCHMSSSFLDKVVKLIGGGSVINDGAYPVQFILFIFLVFETSSYMYYLLGKFFLINYLYVFSHHFCVCKQTLSNDVLLLLLSFVTRYPSGVTLITFSKFTFVGIPYNVVFSLNPYVKLFGTDWLFWHIGINRKFDC